MPTASHPPSSLRRGHVPRQANRLRQHPLRCGSYTEGKSSAAAPCRSGTSACSIHWVTSFFPAVYPDATQAQFMTRLHIRVHFHRNMHGLMRHDAHCTVGIVEEPWRWLVGPRLLGGNHVVERDTDANSSAIGSSSELVGIASLSRSRYRCSSSRASGCGSIVLSEEASSSISAAVGEIPWSANAGAKPMRRIPL